MSLQEQTQIAVNELVHRCFTEPGATPASIYGGVTWTLRDA
jgi:hypothetical protein